MESMLLLLGEVHSLEAMLVQNFIVTEICVGYLATKVWHDELATTERLLGGVILN